MNTKIFVNLPIENLERAVQFFTKVGYTFNKQFTDQNATCMVISDDIFVMLLVKPFFQQFIPGKTIADAKTTTEALVCLSCDSRAAVDELIQRALSAGAREVREPQDHGFMYGWSFYDLDGHHWEVFWMDPSAVK